MDKEMRSRKFILALISLLTGVGALFAGKMVGSEFIMLTGVVLTAYGAANIIPKVMGPK